MLSPPKRHFFGGVSFFWVEVFVNGEPYQGESRRRAAVDTSSRSPGGGHPIACANFCFWRGKGGACERRSWRGGARSPAAAAPAASRPSSIVIGGVSWAKS